MKTFIAGLLVCVILAVIAAGCMSRPQAVPAGTPAVPAPAPVFSTAPTSPPPVAPFLPPVSTAVVPAPGEGIHKIRHVIIIMQENRAFDNYFGTYPGAEGIPMTDGVPTVCVPDPVGGQCIRPYHDANDIELRRPARGVRFHRRYR